MCVYIQTNSVQPYHPIPHPTALIRSIRPIASTLIQLPLLISIPRPHLHLHLLPISLRNSRMQPKRHLIQRETNRRRRNRIQPQPIRILPVRKRTVASVVLQTGPTLPVTTAFIPTHSQVLLPTRSRRAHGRADLRRERRCAGDSAEFFLRPRRGAELLSIAAARARRASSGGRATTLRREHVAELFEMGPAQGSALAVVDPSVGVHDQLVVAQHLPDRECFAAGAGFADGVAVAVRVAVCSEGGGEEEISAAPGVFVARGHLV